MLIGIVAIDGVGCQITAAVQLLNMDRLATVLIYIYGYCTVNGTAGVVTTKYLLKRTVGNVNRYVVVDIGVTGTTVNDIHVLNAVKGHVDFTVHLGVLTATVGFVNLNLAFRSILIYRQGSCAYVTLTVTAAIYIMHITANNIGACNTCTIYVR